MAHQLATAEEQCRQFLETIQQQTQCHEELQDRIILLRDKLSQVEAEKAELQRKAVAVVEALQETERRLQEREMELRKQNLDHDLWREDVAEMARLRFQISTLEETLEHMVPREDYSKMHQVIG